MGQEEKAQCEEAEVRREGFPSQIAGRGLREKEEWGTKE